MAQSVTRTKALKHNVLQFLISLDQVIGCLIAIIVTVLAYIFPSMPYWLSWADETMSSLAHKWFIQKIRSWPRNIIDFGAMLFLDFDHCRKSYASELERTQSPPEHR